MLIKGEQFATLLSQPLLPVYTLYGDDPLLPLEAADALRARAREQGFTERIVLTVLSGFDWNSLREAGGNRSLFGDRQLIDLRIPNGKPGKEGAAALARYCDTAASESEVCLLVSLPALDWKEEKAAWLARLSETGALVKFTAPDLARLPGWIANRLKQQQQSADSESLGFIAERVEGNLLAAHQEIQKLGLLYPPGPLTFEQVKKAVLNVARYDLDGLRMAFLAGDMPRFARTLDGLQHEGEPPPLVLWALSEEIRALATLRSGLEQGRPLDGLMREARVWGPRQNAIKQALQQVSTARSRALLTACSQIDRLIKGIGQEDLWGAFLRLGLLRVK